MMAGDNTIKSVAYTHGGDRVEIINDRDTCTTRVLRRGKLHSVNPNAPAKVVFGAQNITDTLLILAPYDNVSEITRAYFYHSGKIFDASPKRAKGGPGIVTTYQLVDGTTILEYAYYKRGAFQWLIRRDAATGKGHSMCDLPAVVYKSGTLIWMNQGQFHRDPQHPAIITNKLQLYYTNGQLKEVK